jgi:hypothetical protein
MLVQWLDTAARTDNAADRREFLKGVTGFEAPGAKQVVLAGLLAWTLLGGRKK